jgi:hypothetical protein
VIRTALSALLMTTLYLVATVQPAYATKRSCAVVPHEFYWQGQIAGFMVNGRFSYNQRDIPSNGIVREENLLSFSVSFYDPQGRLLRTYENNQDKSRYPTFNFAFDTITKEILQDGTWNVDDDERRFRNGFLMGVGNPDLRDQRGVQKGLAFWTRPRDTAVPHLHVDDWDLAAGPPGAGEFGFPLGFSSHEDVSFPTKTTQDRIDDGRVGKAYFDPNNGVNKLASDPTAFGRPVKVLPATKNAKEIALERQLCRRARG